MECARERRWDRGESRRGSGRGVLENIITASLGGGSGDGRPNSGSVEHGRRERTGMWEGRDKREDQKANARKVVADRRRAARMDDLQHRRS